MNVGSMLERVRDLTLWRFNMHPHPCLYSIQREVRSTLVKVEIRKEYDDNGQVCFTCKETKYQTAEPRDIYAEAVVFVTAGDVVLDAIDGPWREVVNSVYLDEKEKLERRLAKEGRTLKVQALAREAEWLDRYWH